MNGALTVGWRITRIVSEVQDETTVNQVQHGDSFFAVCDGLTL